MKKKIKSFYLIMALLLLFSIYSPLVVHADPASPTDSTSTLTVTDKVDGDNAQVFKIDKKSACWDKDEYALSEWAITNKTVNVITVKPCKVVLVSGNKYYGVAEDDCIVKVQGTDLTDAYNKANYFSENSQLDLVDFSKVLAFDNNGKCIAKADFSAILDMCSDEDKVKPSNSFVFTVGEYDENNALAITMDYNLAIADDSIVSITIDGDCSVKNPDDKLSGNGTYKFSIDGYCVEKDSVSWEVITLYSKSSGTFNIPPINTEDDSTDPDVEDIGTAPNITFSGIPDKKISEGDSFTLKISSDQPVLLYFDGELLNSAEDDYKKEFEYEVTYNNNYAYSASVQAGAEKSGTLNIDCFETTDKPIDDDTYWNGVDDSDTKLAQTGIFNSPIFIIIPIMFFLGIGLIIYTLKFGDYFDIKKN